MFFVTLVLLTLIIAQVLSVYCKITCGLCTSSKQLVGKTVIVTGGNNGIGFETAKDLAERGARVILACRNEGRGTAARDKIVASTGNTDVHYRHLDLASLRSVRAFADDIKTEKRLDVLINNAGISGMKNSKTEDGLLNIMQSNHFGPFLLTNLLLPLLKSSAPSRIINISSIAHKKGKIDFQNLNGEKETEKSYNPFTFYSMSKLCNVLMTVELDRQLKGSGVTANSLHPGAVATDLLNEIPLFNSLDPLSKLFFKTMKEGAQTSIYLAVAPELASTSGCYFVDCREASVAQSGQDIELAKKVWKVSEKIVKLK